jgi:cytochrome P450 family 6
LHLKIEALRMYPPVAILTRTCTKNYTLPGTNVSIDKGTIITIPNWALQKDSEFYEDPEEFIPDRFADEETNRKNQFVHLAFGEGPRQCIGIINVGH